MSDFFVNSEYSPSGDQIAIEQLSNGIMNGDKHQVYWELLDLEKPLQWQMSLKSSKPTLIISHNKTLAPTW